MPPALANLDYYLDSDPPTSGEDRRAQAWKRQAEVIPFSTLNELLSEATAEHATAPAPTEWLETAAETLARFSQLQAGWDSYQAAPIEYRATHVLFDLLSAVTPLGIPQPSIVPTALGGVQAEWHLHGIDLEIEVLPKGDEFQLYYYDEETDSEEEGRLVVDLRQFTSALLTLVERSSER